jgi:hypothetical protein
MSESRETLDLARMVLGKPAPGLAGLWPRAVALLERQALEEALDELWEVSEPTLIWASFRAKLTCLPSYIGDDALALDAGYAWHALSRACHHHHYELDPTAAELDDWLAIVERLVAAVEQRVSEAEQRRKASPAGSA